MKIAGPVNYKPIVQFICDMAQMEYGTASDATHIKNYYVLTILMAGLIDDIDDSVNEILRAADLPISVVIIKLGGVSDTENDFTTLISRAKHSFEQCERQFIEMFDFDNYKVKDAKSGIDMLNEQKLGFDIMKNVPSQIEKFFELQHFDLDVSSNIIYSPEPTNYSHSDNSSERQEYFGGGEATIGNTAALNASLQSNLQNSASPKRQKSSQYKMDGIDDLIDKQEEIKEKTNLTRQNSSGERRKSESELSKSYNEKLKRDSLMEMDDETRRQIKEEMK